MYVICGNCYEKIEVARNENNQIARFCDIGNRDLKGSPKI